MAMRCSFSERGSGSALAIGSVRSRALFVLVAAGMSLMACRTTTTVTYLPSLERQRLSLEQGSATLAQFMQVQCGEVQRSGRTADSVVARVIVGEDGSVNESELQSSSGIGTVDNIIGVVTAQLTFADSASRPPAGASRVLASYDCAAPVSARLRLLQP